MAGYVIANIDANDHDQIQTYREKVAPLVARFGGRYLVRGGATKVLEGNYAIRRLVVIEFPTVADALRFYDSPEYQPIKQIRLDSAVCDLFVAEGYAS